MLIVKLILGQRLEEGIFEVTKIVPNSGPALPQP